MARPSSGGFAGVGPETFFAVGVAALCASLVLQLLLLLAALFPFTCGTGCRFIVQAVEAIGEPAVARMSPTYGGEDFAFVLERLPGAFAFLGVGCVRSQCLGLF